MKKFGKLGEGVVSSNMEVMTKGFELVREINVGEIEAPDRSTLRGKALLPIVMPESLAASEGCGTGCRTIPPPQGQPERTPLTRVAEFDRMFRAKLGYNQPANAYASLGVMAAGSGDTASKYVARRETPLYIPENCTQCMECIAVCPDTALPNCSQDLDTILYAAVTNYVSDAGERQKMLTLLPGDRASGRASIMREAVAKSAATPAQQFIKNVTQRGQRLLAGGEGRVLQRHRQGADGVPQGQRDLRDAGEEEPGRRAASSRSSSRISARGARPASLPAASTRRCGWCRRPRRSTPSTKAAPRSSTFCPTRRRSISASTTTCGRRTRRPRRCATC